MALTDKEEEDLAYHRYMEKKLSNEEYKARMKGKSLSDEDQESLLYHEYMVKKLVNKKLEDDGGCFITTAVVNSLGKSDSCNELMTFRKFRDNFVLPNYPKEVYTYYQIAPTIVSNINRCEHSKEIYSMIWEEYLLVAYLLILSKENESAFQTYKNAMRKLKLMYYSG